MSEQLTEENYFEWNGMFSNSFIKSYKKCPYSATLKKKQEFKQCFFEGHFIEGLICEGEKGGKKVLNRGDYKDHVLTQSGSPYAWVTKSRYYADVVRKDEVFMSYINDPNTHFQDLITGTIGGHKFKSLQDCVNVEEGYILDLKTCGKPFSELIWCDERKKKLNFIELFEYHKQLAIYKELAKQKYGKEFSVMIGAVTKTNPADVEIFDLTDCFDWRYLLREIVADCDKISYEMSLGIIEKCGKCNDCISVKKIKSPVNYDLYFNK